MDKANLVWLELNDRELSPAAKTLLLWICRARFRSGGWPAKAKSPASSSIEPLALCLPDAWPIGV